MELCSAEYASQVADKFTRVVDGLRVDVHTCTRLIEQASASHAVDMELSKELVARVASSEADCQAAVTASASAEEAARGMVEKARAEVKRTRALADAAQAESTSTLQRSAATLQSIVDMTQGLAPKKAKLDGILTMMSNIILPV